MADIVAIIVTVYCGLAVTTAFYLNCRFKAGRNTSQDQFLRLTINCLIVALLIHGTMALLGALGYVDYDEEQNIPLQ